MNNEVNIVNRDGSIKSPYFRCLRTGAKYMIIKTVNSFEGPAFWKDSAFKAIDTVKRLSDGVKKDYNREALEKRFTNIEILEI